MSYYGWLMPREALTMERKRVSLYVIGLVLVLLSSGCAKKIVPVSGSASLRGKHGNETGRDLSGSGDTRSLKEEAIGFEGLSGGDNSGIPQNLPQVDHTDESTRDRVDHREDLKGLEDVFFAYDRAVLQKDARETLQDNARQLSIHSRAKIQIQGHTDERGSSEYNLTLGARRARTVKRFLEALGVESSRIRIISFGEEKPFCKKSRESCWKMNRRVHFMLQH